MASSAPPPAAKGQAKRSDLAARVAVAVPAAIILLVLLHVGGIVFTIGVTAIGLITTDPFSFVVVISVHFLPKIEIGFGFTLNGVGTSVCRVAKLSTS